MQRDDERRERRKKLIIGVFIAGIMILSTFGFVLNYATESGHTEKVKGIKFQENGRQVVAVIQGKTLGFSYFPSQVEHIPVDAQVVRTLTTTPTFYITSDPGDPFAKDIDNVAFFMSTVLPEVKDVYPTPGFTNATGFERPEVGCANATADVPVLYLHYGKTTGINMTGACIDASAASSYDIYRLNDKLMYLMLGVDDGTTD